MCHIQYEFMKGREKQKGAARFKEPQLEGILHEHDLGEHRFFTLKDVFIYNNTLVIWIWKNYQFGDIRTDYCHMLPDFSINIFSHGVNKNSFTKMHVY